ncbi:MAG: Ig-like domain-containing protein, partial [Gemmatimonadota bacterium]|nr:Ig-like domain-containing protein [Gemmatimonadota bacterium]
MVGHTNPSMSVAFRFSLILIAGLALLVIATCGKDSPTKPTPPPQPPTPPPAQPVPTRITITPATTTLTSIGQTVQHSATVLDQNGQPVPGAVVTWSSSNAAVATVNSQGLVTAVMNGTAQITARSGNVSTSINVTVMQAAVRITITPITATLMAIGETVQFSAAVLDQNGQPVDG